MSKDTTIQWCDSTVNPTTGCDGCELWKAGKGGPCYAGNFHEGRLAKSLPKLYAANFDEVRLVPGRMAQAAKWGDLAGTARPAKPWLDGMPRVIFVGDMGDVFSAAVTFEFLRDEVIGAAASTAGRRHVWMLLTKRPTRMARFHAWLGAGGIEWPGNVWCGTTVTGPKTVDRLSTLLAIPDVTRFASFEPVLSPFPLPGPNGLDYALHLAIYGGESRQGRHEPRPFDVDWCRDQVEACRRRGVAPFVKQLGTRPTMGGEPLKLRDEHGGDPAEWPAGLPREFPRDRIPTR